MLLDVVKVMMDHYPVEMSASVLVDLVRVMVEYSAEMLLGSVRVLDSVPVLCLPSSTETSSVSGAQVVSMTVWDHYPVEVLGSVWVGSVWVGSVVVL